LITQQLAKGSKTLLRLCLYHLISLWNF